MQIQINLAGAFGYFIYENYFHNSGHWYMNATACPQETGKALGIWPSWGGARTYIRGWYSLKTETAGRRCSCRNILTNTKEIKTRRARINQIKLDKESRWNFKRCQGQEERMSSVVRAWGQRDTLGWPAGQPLVSHRKSVDCSKPQSRYVSPREHSDIYPVAQGVTPPPPFF